MLKNKAFVVVAAAVTLLPQPATAWHVDPAHQHPAATLTVASRRATTARGSTLKCSIALQPWGEGCRYRLLGTHLRRDRSRHEQIFPMPRPLGGHFSAPSLSRRDSQRATKHERGVPNGRTGPLTVHTLYLGPKTRSIARPSAASPSGVDVAWALMYPTDSAESPDSSETNPGTEPNNDRGGNKGGKC